MFRNSEKCRTPTGLIGLNELLFGDGNSRLKTQIKITI